MSVQMKTGIGSFGKDHWSLLAYVEACCVDHGGVLDLRHMRCNPCRHPLLADSRVHRGWKPEWGTRLKGGTILEHHDDWDCLEDLEEAGLVEIVSTVNGIVRLTPSGETLAARLRLHKQRGGGYANFDPGC